MTELSGFNFKRQEFEIEYDNDAEQILADMEFKDTDSAADRELKLRVLRIYSKRLPCFYLNVCSFCETKKIEKRNRKAIV